MMQPSPADPQQVTLSVAPPAQAEEEEQPEQEQTEEEKKYLDLEVGRCMAYAVTQTVLGSLCFLLDVVCMVFTLSYGTGVWVGFFVSTDSKY